VASPKRMSRSCLHRSLRKTPSKRSPRRNIRPELPQIIPSADRTRGRSPKVTILDRDPNLKPARRHFSTHSPARRNKRRADAAADPRPFAGGDHSRRRAPRCSRASTGRAKLLTVSTGATRQPGSRDQRAWRHRNADRQSTARLERPSSSRGTKRVGGRSASCGSRTAERLRTCRERTQAGHRLLGQFFQHGR